MENGEDSVESDFPPSRYTQKRRCVIFESEDDDVVLTRSKANRIHVHKSTAVSKKKEKKSQGFKTPAKSQASKRVITARNALPKDGEFEDDLSGIV